MTAASEDPALRRGASLFHGLADRNRLAIVRQLSAGERRVVGLTVDAHHVSRRADLLVLGVLLALAASVLVVAASGGREPVAGDSPEGYALPRPETRAPFSAVRPVHRALHTPGEVCPPDADLDRSTAAESAVDVILRFARRQPDVRFPIHDEVDTTPSLLFVARDSVRSCAPWLTARIERLIPAEYLPEAAG